MSQSFRISSAVVLLLALSFSWSAAPVEHDALQARITDSVRGAIDALGVSVDAHVLDDAALRANALTFIRIDSSIAEPAVTLNFAKTPMYRAVMDVHSARLTVEFMDTVLLSDAPSMSIDSSQTILGVENTLALVHPQFVSRTVIRLAEACAYRIRVTGTSLSIVLSPESKISKDDTVQGMSADDLAAATLEEAMLRADRSSLNRVMELEDAFAAALRSIERTKVALLTAELAEVSPASSATRPSVSVDAVRRELSVQDSATQELGQGLEQLLAAREGRRAGVREELSTTRADVDSLEIILNRFSAGEEAFEQDLNLLLTKLSERAKVNERLALKMEQRSLGTASPVIAIGGTGDLDRLDMAFSSLRGNEEPFADMSDSLDALDTAMELVAAAPVNLALSDRAQMATLGKSTADTSSAIAPPVRRARKVNEVARAHRIENPMKLAVLRSSSADLRRAEDNGILVMAQQETDGISDALGRPATPVQSRVPSSGPRRYRVPKASGARPQFNLYNENLPASQDPLRVLVDIDFREMDLSNVVSLLAEKGEINVVAGTEVTGTISANLKNIPLGRAIEIVLRMNGFGIVEEAGVYRITTYAEAISAQRETRMIFLKNAQADEVKATLDEVLTNATNGDLVSVSANPATNVVILSGPRVSVEQLEGVIAELDIAEPVVPTLILPIKLNYSDPLEMVLVVKEIISDQGSVSADVRGRHIIVTDIPVKVQEIEALINLIDLPVKQVSVDAMIVDAQLDDDAQTGIEWILNSVSSNPSLTSSTFETEDGVLTTNTEGIFLPKASIANAFAPSAAGSQIFFTLLSGDLDLSALIAAEVSSSNAELLANPSITTIENKTAIINITQEFPYQELTQTSEGGSIGTTKFKEIGTILTVTPRVTHDYHIIVDITAKESTVVGFTNAEVPIEAKRQAETSLRMADGQTIFIGGMRSYEERLSVRKAPILGDIPILNFLFTNKRSEQTNTELLIFLTCNVLDDPMGELTPYEKTRFDKLGGTPWKVDGTRALVNSYVHPEEMRDPFYKWKRTK